MCYCGSSNCRGYISKASQTTDLSSSDDSDESISENRVTSKPEEKQRRRKTLNNRTIYNDKNKLREVIILVLYICLKSYKRKIRCVNNNLSYYCFCVRHL